MEELLMLAAAGIIIVGTCAITVFVMRAIRTRK